jgi:endonuclease III
VKQYVRSMQADCCLDVESISQMTPEKLNSYIRKVGFHNNKTKYIKQVVEILKEEYAGDIPPTAAAMMELPGIGPKMAFICENVAWDKHSGIGVDTHMHRLFNELGWVKSKNPEQTRVQLEAWLPEDKWTEVNILWVGFGQEVQQFKPKILRKALDCSRPAEALRLLKRCGLDYRKEGKKLNLEEEIAEALTQQEQGPADDDDDDDAADGEGIGQAEKDVKSTGLPSSAAVYLARLQKQQKELYKNPPALPPTIVVVESTYQSLPERDKKTGELNFSAGGDEALVPLLKLFHPNRSPEEILRGGGFGGTYFRSIVSAVTNQQYTAKQALEMTLPKEWIQDLDQKTVLTSQKYNQQVNKYKSKCGGSLGMWESSGWISDAE